MLRIPEDCCFEFGQRLTDKSIPNRTGCVLLHGERDCGTLQLRRVSVNTIDLISGSSSGTESDAKSRENPSDCSVSFGVSYGWMPVFVFRDLSVQTRC